MSLRLLVAIALIASCSHPPARRPKKQPRIALEPDDTRAGAIVLTLADNRATYRGRLDGPASDTLDWLRVARPGPNGKFVIELRANPDTDVWLRFFDADKPSPEMIGNRAFEGGEIGAEHSRTVDGFTTFEVGPGPGRLLIEVSEGERVAGQYELAVRFVETPDVVAVPTPPEPPKPLPYCAVGVIADTCRHAPSCDWVRIDGANPRCAPQYRPPPQPGYR